MVFDLFSSFIILEILWVEQGMWINEIINVVVENKNKKTYKKATIPKAIREQCWIKIFGKQF